MKSIHASDCAVHNEPAYPNGPCDCGAERMNELIAKLRDYTYTGDSWITQQEAADAIERLTAELGDLPESQSEMMAEIKRLKAYAAKADIELGNLEDKLREAHAMSATLSHAARVSHRWEQGEIDKVKARVRAALEETKG